jgi:hypothetical protein
LLDFPVPVVLTLVGIILVSSWALHYLRFIGEDFSLKQNEVMTFPASPVGCLVYLPKLKGTLRYTLSNADVCQWIVTHCPHILNETANLTEIFLRFKSACVIFFAKSLLIMAYTYRGLISRCVVSAAAREKDAYYAV